MRTLVGSGGGETAFEPPRRTDPGDIALPPGYRIEAVAEGLDFPTAIAFDEQERMYVTEAGYSYGEYWGVPRLVRMEPDGSRTVIAEGKSPPWNGVVFHDGAFFVAEGGAREGGRILRIGADGSITPLTPALPSMGDHHTNGPAVGPDGWIYFGVGTATNSAVVGIDSHDFGWLERHPGFHDIPGQDIVLAGKNYTTPDPLSEDSDDVAVTGAYVPFGTPTHEGQIIKGATPCTGAVMRTRPDGGGLELVAWGLRNPFGLAFSPDGQLYVTENSYDVRGSRPVWGTGDLLWRIEPGVWYGWPDFHAGRPLTDDDWYEAPGEPEPGFVLAEHPNTPPRPAATLGVHASACRFDFSQNEAFGHTGQAFIAEFGDMAPGVGGAMSPVGYQVVRVDVQTGVIEPFAVNRAGYGPASFLEGNGLERPIDARFGPDGAALFIVDFGVMTMDGKKPQPRPGTGVIWKITREGQP